MGSATGILLALATVFVAAECILPFAERREIIPSSGDTGSSCRKGLARCGNLWGPSASTNYDINHLHFLVDNIDGICRREQQLADCVRSVVGDCVTEFRVAVESTLAVGEYICSDRGRSLLAESTDSLCYIDPSQEDVVNVLSNDCTTSRFDDSLTHCQNMNTILACTVEAITQQCGQAVGNFTGELTNIYVATAPQLQC